MSTLPAFIDKWSRSAASERANAQMFLTELCDLLGVPRPDAATNDAARDRYVFEKVVPTPDEKGGISQRRIDLYKEGCFILEAKQGGSESGGAAGAGRRGSQLWHNAMQAAWGQAVGYARSLERPPPFLIVVDVGHCFELHASFDGTASYRHFPSPQLSRFFLPQLGDHLDTLRAIFTDPWSLDPARAKVAITRDVAECIAVLASKLEADGHDPVVVAKFLMRCLFTMFAEDVGLLPEHLFTRQLEDEWIREPRRFAAGMESLWHSMNAGAHFGFVGKLLKFNGGLFASQEALPLTAEQLLDLLAAAQCDWAEVEPSIFGTLLERALDKDERHKLGAHYTPRAYVERLVRPTIEEPVRNEWALVCGHVRQLREGDKIEQARKEVHAFHRRLCNIRVLDPACGTGNFLYVTLDVFKRIEAEIFQLLADLGEAQQRLELHYEETVTPRQFLGIEVKPWAKEIAELVLWIGYLQWHFRTFGRVSPPEPVLHDHKNIECRDAVLAWDRIEFVRDERGRPVTRWDGRTTKKHPVTGEDVPDESARVDVVKYVNPRKAEWPEAEFIVGNPPFIGGWRIRQAQGDGYVEALWKQYQDVPEKADYVMYWWKRASELLLLKQCRRFGFITTNSISQVFQRRIIDQSLQAGVMLAFAIPDHPWVDSADGAAVRIAMTTATLQRVDATLATVVTETAGSDARSVRLSEKNGRINSDLTIGADLSRMNRLSANAGIISPGVQLYGDGFIIDAETASEWGPPADRARKDGVLRRYINGRDLFQQSRGVEVIDFIGYDEARAKREHPALYQHVLLRVKPERDQNRREPIRKQWWRFGWERPALRVMIRDLRRFIATPETSKHRAFIFLDAEVLPDNTLTAIGSEDADILGILSSRIHVSWVLAAGGRMGVGNDPRYTKSRCFDPFPFPACTEAQKLRIREIGEQLDSHRKRQQALYPDLTITGMYNVLEKLRAGEALSAKEKVIHEQGLVTLLRQIHDELDAAVFDAYGWPRDLSDEQILERLVALNAERAEEEKKGLVRWLRPDFQNPGGKAVATQFTMAGTEARPEGEEPAAESARTWPKKVAEQIAAVRDLLLRSTSTWSEAEVQGAFKGAKRKEVAAALETLVALGIGVSYSGKDEVRYRAAGRAVA